MKANGAVSGADQTTFHKVQHILETLTRGGTEHGTLPGGRYACVRLQGEPPTVYEQIGPTAERLSQRPDADHTRPTLEYYRRCDVIDILVPII